MEGALDVLRAHLNKVRIPSASNKVYKEECCVSFDTTKSEGGLFVDLNSFLGFGREYVKWNYEKTGDPVYLHIKKTRRPDPEDEQPRKKPTIVAIGVDGGFSEKQDEYDESLSICVLPDFIQFPYPDVNLPEKVRSAVEQVLAAQGAERRDQLAAWTADAKTVSKYAEGLKQADNEVRIGATGWRCRFCDKTDNLWLNLSDGSILCGRKNWDGTGGNNHALEYYQQTQFPLVVKLGTIAADLTQADVYSYPEDDAVEDPLLAKHLQHFGIDFSALQKTESTTAELELDQNLNFDFTRLQEKGKQLEPLFGPGYTGLANLGNSCYLASVVQALLTTNDFRKRYFDDADLEAAFKQAPSDPTLDFNFQMTKLAHGILSGAYSRPPIDSGTTPGTETSKSEGEGGIAPRMFKALVGQGHPEFSSARQQDAFEFYQHLLDLVEKASRGAPQGDPSRAFRFQVQERIVCGASGRVRRTARSDNALSLQIPLDRAINADEVAAYQQRKAASEAAGEKLAADDVVRPRVPLSACLEAFAAPETIQDFYSSAIRGKSAAQKSAALGTFPPLLVLHMRKFVLDAGWVPRKLDVFVDVPDTLDLAPLRAAGPAPDEQALPDDDDDAPGSAPAGPVPDPGIVSTLEDMGFPRVRCEKAALATQNAGPEEAMNWLLAHMDDPDIDSPVPAPGGRPAVLVDEAAVETLTAIGFSAAAVRRALQETGGNVEAAAEWVFAHPEAGEAMDVQEANGPDSAAGAAAGTPLSKDDFLDGPPKYNLLAFVSHMGSSTHAGHYVAHIKKDGRWVIFNDSKVAASGDPPRDMGYLYFYQREG